MTPSKLVISQGKLFFIAYYTYHQVLLIHHHVRKKICIDVILLMCMHVCTVHYKYGTVTHDDDGCIIVKLHLSVTEKVD